MNIRDSDIIKLRKDIERVRKHEESRRAQKTPEEPAQPASSTKLSRTSRPLLTPIAVRLRSLIESLLAPSEASIESRQIIPEHVVTLLQIIHDEPKFERWLLAIETLPPAMRNQQLEKMAFAFRVEDKNSTIADSFDSLQNSSLFKAFCQSLRDAQKIPS